MSLWSEELWSVRNSSSWSEIEDKLGELGAATKNSLRDNDYWSCSPGTEYCATNSVFASTKSEPRCDRSDRISASYRSTSVSRGGRKWRRAHSSRLQRWHTHPGRRAIRRSNCTNRLDCDGAIHRGCRS